MPPDESEDIAVPMGALPEQENFMRAPLLLVISSMLLVEVLPASGQAQLIDVSSGSVRAPFVRVQRRGRLRDRIRGRFVDEDTSVEEEEPNAIQQRYPGALTPPPVPPATPLSVEPGTGLPPSMTQSPTTRADWQGLRTSIVAAETELHQQLSRSPAGDTYRQQLRVGRLRSLLPETMTTPPSGQTRQELNEILQAYNRTLIDPRQRSVSRLSGFEEVQAGLMVLLAPAEIVIPRSNQVSVDRGSSPPRPQRAGNGEPQPTQVLPPVRDAR